jgi:primosomal protein N' (replication factor Y)
MPDFRAAERCFMLITQTAGRAGRGHIPGHVVIQTYNPDHYAVQCGIRQDYAGFYQKELGMRQQFFYPPFSRLIKLLFQDKESSRAQGRALNCVRDFQKAFAGQQGQQIIGPAPAVIACLRGTYRYVVLIKTSDLQAAQAFLRQEQLHLRADVAIDIDPLTML